MKELNKGATASETGVNPAGELLDESTKEVLDDYSRKFLSFIQQEKDKVRKQVIAESERTLVEAQHKARLIQEKAVKESEAKAETILADCRSTIDNLVSEADRLSTVTADMRAAVEKQLQDIAARLRKESEIIAEYIQKADRAINESREKLMTEFDTAANVTVQLKEKLKEIRVNRSENGAAGTAPNESAREDKSEKSAHKDTDHSGKRSDENFVGTLNLMVYKGSPALFRRFREALARVPGIEISSTEDYSKDKAKVVLFVNRPMPLLGMIQQMGLVKSASGEGDKIEVILEESDRWVG